MYITDLLVCTSLSFLFISQPVILMLHIAFIRLFIIYSFDYLLHFIIHLLIFFLYLFISRFSIGEDWKFLTGANQPQFSPKTSPGYDHSAFWPRYVSF